MEAELNRCITRNDLTLIANKALALTKLVEATLIMSDRLTGSNSDVQDVRELIDRCRQRLRRQGLTTKQRQKLAQTLEYHHECLDVLDADRTKQYPAFSKAVCKIESVLRDLAVSRDELAKVHRFEHVD